MATTAAPPTVITDEQRRWVVTGICLNKLLTPVLRNLLGREIPVWYKSLCLPPSSINTQTFAKHEKKLHPSNITLNYGNINKNFVNHKSKHSSYDYAVKDAISLAKLFLQPFMAKFTGFDTTMDLSAALTLICESHPFYSSGAAAQAKIVRSVVRNEWAHCNFSHWTDVNFFACIQEIELLVRKLNMAPADEKDFLDELNNWKNNGVHLCCGQAVDADLLKLIRNEFSQLLHSVELWREENQNIEVQLRKELNNLGHRLESLERHIDERLDSRDEKSPYLFMLPDRAEWFSGRESELNNLHSLFNVGDEVDEPKVKIVSICGLGGTGKTSLAAGTITETNPDGTLTRTLIEISKIQRPWLLVLDDMDEYSLCHNIKVLLSGPWKRSVRASGHILITTRRKPKLMSETIPRFHESECLQLECFNDKDGLQFISKRTGFSLAEEAAVSASSLVKILGGLPLALEQACAYISRLPCTLSEYLEQYKKYSIELLRAADASPASLYESQERLAVRTTWLLNFEYIKQSENGSFAVRFLNACAFFNPTKIQQELVNPGKPPIEDDGYRDYVGTPLGSLHILKLLSDFSLFRKNKDSSLTVHRLVLDVIKGKLRSDGEEVLALVDAISMLSFGFSKCPSPDDLLLHQDINTQRERVSNLSINPTLFCLWQTLCLHAQEVVTILKSFQVLDERVILPETAKIVYECALDLNVRSKVLDAMRYMTFAHKIMIHVKEGGDLAALFPHKVPLHENIRRYIFYSCMTPYITTDSTSPDKQKQKGSKHKMEQMQILGYKHFENGQFNQAIEMYTSAMAEFTQFDPELLHNRAVAYMGLEQYENALTDTENYISQRPKYWLGFAIKALALHGLNRAWEASSFAALAFYHNRNIFSEYKPFKLTFSGLKDRIQICNSSSQLNKCLSNVLSGSKASPEIPGKIILIESGVYRVRLSYAVSVDNCILLGTDKLTSSVELNFKDLICILGKQVMAANVSLVFSKGYCISTCISISSWYSCSFTCTLEEGPYTFYSLGCDTFNGCFFKNSKSPGLTVQGKADVNHCVFSGGEYSGINVSTGGCVNVKGSEIHGNDIGLYFAREPLSCTVAYCNILDNKRHGIYVTLGTSNVSIDNCRIYHNDHNGVFLEESSSASVSNCEIFENGWQGISTIGNSRCTVLRNKIYGNKSGGVQVVPVDQRKPVPPSIVKENEIFDNHGFGIYCEMMYEDTPSDTSLSLSKDAFVEYIRYLQNSGKLLKAECIENTCYENESTCSSISTNDITTYVDFCSHCRKRCSHTCRNCYFTAYCNKECQKSDWRKHKKECRAILERSTICISTSPDSCMIIEHNMYVPSFSPQHPGVEPKGPMHACKPKAGERFLVKILAADDKWHVNVDGPMFSICDRSLTINGRIDHRRYPELYNIILQCGVNSTLVQGWKKKFFWALLHEKDQGMLRVFITELPKNENW
ncbi:uncharacterized protein LOC114515537 isoform X2 [Dendronephthya gigantea]|uniref:uncharacterized protein LOC114515537 isoform X2 n=1 Tax=Dendronephthya gigantea TaxID=151771 RepID=UPI00106C42D6|nr:uncharacterized protein LOC114515537 isoform X2 [Dendronephthya gigantea]